MPLSSLVKLAALKYPFPPVVHQKPVHRVLAIVELDDISLDSVVGEFGRPLSGGEAKRLGLARALLSPAAILILDEPTEHLDHALAARIEERVLERYADRILIIITHSGWGKAGRTVTLERE